MNTASDIKFKIYNPEIESFHGVFTLNELKQIIEGKFDHVDLHVMMADWPSLQFLKSTGFKDKNGKEIFEGDSLRSKSSNPFSQGEITEKYVMFGEVGWYMEGTYSNLSEWLHDHEWVEIVGNKVLKNK
jgi:hypothetical protein